MKAREIMTSDPCCVTPDETIRHAAELMRDSDIGMVPVVSSNKQLLGVVTDRDITVRHVAEGHDGSCLVKEVMSQGLITASPEDDIMTVMDKMRERQVRRLPVVENGKLVGVIAQADIAQHGDEEEVGETVGEISESRGGKNELR